MHGFGPRLLVEGEQGQGMVGRLFDLPLPAR
jgi:hypothetical protein